MSKTHPRVVWTGHEWMGANKGTCSVRAVFNGETLTFEYADGVDAMGSTMWASTGPAKGFMMHAAKLMLTEQDEKAKS